MKKSFMFVSLMGLGMVHASATVEATFKPSQVETQNQSQFSALTQSTPIQNTTAPIPNINRSTQNIDLVDSLESLTIQSKQHSEQLAGLSDTLTINQTSLPTASFATSSNKLSNSFNRSSIDSSAPPAVAAAKAARAAHARTKGLCARYVRKALQAAGYNFTPNPSAYQYATRGTLAKAGFVKISNSAPPQVGDVVVYNRSSKHRHGHIQIFDGNQWVSDFRQRKKSPYSGNYSYTTWRDARYLNDASNEGMYLAMED